MWTERGARSFSIENVHETTAATNRTRHNIFTIAAFYCLAAEAMVAAIVLVLY